MNRSHKHNGTLTGYWAMTHDEREKHDAHLLDDQRLQRLAPDKRKAYVEALYAHTLIGTSITFHMLNNPDYASHLEHLKDVLDSFLDRQDTLLRYLKHENET
ncbi:MAG: hypothetical protein NVSMB49_14630 [Ktedonobacteraceae bacterium]